MITIRDLVRLWENISYDSTVQIKCYKHTKYKKFDYIGDVKIQIRDIMKETNPFNDLTLQQVVAFRKSVNGIRIEICEDLSNES
jgi:hypothetical protein